MGIENYSPLLISFNLALTSNGLMKLKNFLPPILLYLIKNRSMKEYKSFEYAQTCSDTYEDPAVIDIVSHKTKVYKEAILSENLKEIDNPQITQNMFVLSHIKNDRALNVLEIGGACGATYFILNHLLPGKINSWYVVETPSMANVGKKLFQNQNLKFFMSISEAVSEIHKSDIIIAQGALQYTNDPLNTFKELLKMGFNWIYISRTIVGLDIEFPIITKQVVNLSEHGPGQLPKGFKNRKTSQPLTIIPFDSLKNLISDDYDPIFSFIDSKPNKLKIGPRSVQTKTIGYLLKKYHTN